MTDFENDPGYEQCLVTFFDILGFRNLLHTKSSAEISQFLSIFRQASQGDDITPATRSEEHRLHSEVMAEIVSDAIVRVRTIETQYYVGALYWELLDLLHIQIDCLNAGILVRGAMTIGHMHVGTNLDGPIFGPALVQAYEMEGREVIYPRIAVHEDVLARLRSDERLRREEHTIVEEEKYLSHILIEDEAGLHWIDYLRASLSEFESHYPDWLAYLDEHKRLIETGRSDAANASVRRKYNWMKIYHNRVVEEALAKLKPNAKLEDGQGIERLLTDLIIT
jgi:hypothetical protein